MNFLNKLIGRQSSIPKIIHYVWVGDKKLTDNNLELIKTWKKHNPEYKIICWNNDNIDLKNRYIRNALLLKNYANVSNLVRMMAVYEHGGIYLDTDIKCLKSFNPLLDQACFFGHCIKEKNSDWVNNAIFGATKKHWFIKNMINNISKLYDRAEAANLSSPRLLTSMLVDLGLSYYSEDIQCIKDISLYPIKYFYPYNWFEKYSKRFIVNDTYTIHYWEKRWK